VTRGLLPGRQPVWIYVKSLGKLVDHLHRGIALVGFDTGYIGRSATGKRERPLRKPRTDTRPLKAVAVSTLQMLVNSPRHAAQAKRSTRTWPNVINEVSLVAVLNGSGSGSDTLMIAAAIILIASVRSICVTPEAQGFCDSAELGLALTRPYAWLSHRGGQARSCRTSGPRLVAM
jgi:hypothetical protein